MAEMYVGKEKEEHFPPDVVKKLRELQTKTEEMLREILGIRTDLKDGEEYADDYTYFLMLKHDKSSVALYTGNGCPVCAVGSAMGWVMSNDLRHTENGTPLFEPVVLPPSKPLRKKDIN